MKLDRLRIIQVAAPTSAGGAERVIEALAVGHHRRGHHVTVGTLLPENGERHPFVETLTSQGVEVHPIRVGRRAYLSERRHLKTLCHAVRPDIVHLHGYRLEINNRGMVARLGFPTVTTIHGASMMGGPKGAFFEWLQRRNHRHFDAVVAVSSPLYEQAIKSGVPRDRLHLVPNAWSGLRQPLEPEQARAELGLELDRPVVGWVGRFIHVKGGDLFLDGLSRIPTPRPLAAMIGYGPEADRLRRQARELGIGDSVKFYPDVRDAGRYFSAFDTFVLSSRSEGLPIVILEAMAAGTPIVATRVGGVPDALTEEGGWLVPAEDAKSLAEAITESLCERPEAARRARIGTSRLRTHYSLTSFLDRYVQVYRSVSSGSG